MKKSIIIFTIVFSFVSLFSYPVSSSQKQNRENPPTSANIKYPGINANQVTESPAFAWQAASGNLSGYKFYLGSDGQGVESPTNLVNGADLGNVLNYYPDLVLELNQTYYWQVIPYHVTNGDAENCPIWVFQTKAEASLPNPYRNYFNDISGFTGNITMSNNGGTQDSGGGLSSGLSGNFQTINAIGPNSSTDQLVFYYRLSEFQLGDSASQDPSFLRTYISYDNINFQEINSLSCYDENLNNQYNKITIDLTDYPGTFYVKFTYNIYHFYYSFFGTSNDPRLYLDNLFIRENSGQVILNVSPESWNIENGSIHTSYNQNVVITNYSNFELSIENLSIPINPISLNNFSLNSSQSIITLAEGFSYSFSISFSANEYGYCNSLVTYEYSANGGVYPGDPTQTLMFLTADCPNPHIYTFPYLQDFSQWPPLDWIANAWHQSLDSNNKSWATSPDGMSMSYPLTLVSPSFYSTLPLTVQYKLSIPDEVCSNIQFKVQIGYYHYFYQLISWETIDSFITSENITYQYDDGVLINQYVFINMEIPSEYIGTPFILQFEHFAINSSRPKITDFKIFHNEVNNIGILQHPELSISRENSHNVLWWDHIYSANNYEIQASSDLENNVWQPITITPYQGYVYDGNEEYKFFRVKALRNSLP